MTPNRLLAFAVSVWLVTTWARNWVGDFMKRTEFEKGKE